MRRRKPVRERGGGAEWYDTAAGTECLDRGPSRGIRNGQEFERNPEKGAAVGAGVGLIRSRK